MRFALVSFLLAGLAVQQADVKKIVPDADKAKALSRKISKDAREKIEKALGEKLDDKELSPALSECYSIVPAVSTMEKTRCLVCTVNAKGAKGNLRIGVAVAPEQSVLHAVKILDNGGDKDIDAAVFLSQFPGMEYTGALYGSRDALAGALKKAEEAKDIDALVRINLLMRDMGMSWYRMSEKIAKKDKSAAEEIAAMEGNLAESLKLLSGASFLNTSRQDTFKKYAGETKNGLAKVKGAVGAGDFDEAGKGAADVDKVGCARCHAPLRGTFRKKREESGLGNGHFSIKLDVGVPDKSKGDAYQSLANGIRKAILLASEAK